MDIKRYSGRVVTVRPGEHYGFIGLATVKGDDSSRGLASAQDIFVHQDDCSVPLAKDLEVSFEVIPDTERGGSALRAVEVNEIVVGELVLVGESATSLAEPQRLYVPPAPTQRIRMKPVSEEAVLAVLANKPMPRMSRDSQPVDSADASRDIIARIFPQFAAISEESGGDLADESFDAIIGAAVEDHRSLGMNTQAEHMLRHANVYKGLRTVLRSENDLLKPETIIPLQYLPDLFMAVPVWYFWADPSTAIEARRLMQDTDPRIHAKLAAICELVPNQRWVNTFLMFNRRMRTLADYQGDIIPPKVIARMRKMAPLFDHLVIMTPYHDVAGKDWEDLSWLRSIDPYVVGFLKGVPVMFVVGRFSDSGVFPLHSELLADTIQFLRENALKLRGFNRANQPYWHVEGRRDAVFGGRLGDELVGHARSLLAAFDRGELFDWLRGDERKVPAKAR